MYACVVCFVLCACEDTTPLKFGGGGVVLVHVFVLCIVCFVLCVTLLSSSCVWSEKPHEDKVSFIQFLRSPSRINSWMRVGILS